MLDRKLLSAGRGVLGGLAGRGDDLQQPTSRSDQRELRSFATQARSAGGPTAAFDTTLFPICPLTGEEAEDEMALEQERVRAGEIMMVGGERGRRRHVGGLDCPCRLCPAQSQKQILPLLLVSSQVGGLLVGVWEIGMRSDGYVKLGVCRTRPQGSVGQAGNFAS